MMTDSSPPAASPPQPAADDAWLECLLHQDASAAAPLADGGFTNAVMNRLPAPAGRSPSRWIVPAMGLLGCLIGLVWFSGGENLSLSLASLAQAKSVSLQPLLVAALPVGLFYWLALGAAWQEP